MSSRSTSLTEGVSLESVFELCHDTATLMRAMNTKLRGVEEKTVKLATSLKEVNDYIKTYCSQPFAIKGSRFEGLIKTEVAKLFLLSLGRKPEDSDVKAALVRILGRENVRNRKKFDAAYTYAKNKLTDYRTEERRKVVGGVPCENACYEDTATLKRMIIDSLLPTGEEFSDDDQSTYHKHLAILRKFVRDSPFFPATNFYVAFREWLDTNYHTLDDTEWTQIVDEDKDMDYATIGCGIDSEVMEQVIGNEEQVAELLSTVILTLVQSSI